MKAILTLASRTAVLWSRAVAVLTVTLAQAHAGSVSLLWNKNPEPDVVGYRVHYGRTGGSPTNHIDLGSATNATVTGLQEGNSYMFYATAYNSAGLESELSVGVSHTVAVAGNNLAVSWDPSFSPSAVNYAIFYGPPAQNPTRRDVGTNLTATITNVVRGATYEITAEAYDNSGTLVTEYEVKTYKIPTSGSVGSVELLPIDQPPVVVLTSPANGSNYPAPGAIQISATASDDDAVQFVDIFAGTNLLARVATPPYQFTWNSVPAGTYEIHAVAVDTSDQYSESASAMVGVGTPLETAPNAPSGLNARFIRTSGDIRVTWTDNSDNENAFVIERSTNNSTFNALATLPADATAYHDANVVSGARYYYRVRALNDSGSNPSATVSARAR
jgi:hypothetical protein